MDNKLSEIARLIRVGMSAIIPNFPPEEVKEIEDDFEGEGLDGYIQFSGLYVFPRKIQVIRNSILGKRPVTVNGYILARGVTIYSNNRFVQDDHEIVDDSQYEHPGQAAFAAVSLYVNDRIADAFNADGIAQSMQEDEYDS